MDIDFEHDGFGVGSLLVEGGLPLCDMFLIAQAYARVIGFPFDVYAATEVVPSDGWQQTVGEDAVQVCEVCYVVEIVHCWFMCSFVVFICGKYK